jgi:hypothetical protein
MLDSLKMYVVLFTEPALGFRVVIAGSYRIEGEHLIFLTEDGRLSALFLLEIVKRWSCTDVIPAGIP